MVVSSAMHGDETESLRVWPSTRWLCSGRATSLALSKAKGACTLRIWSPLNRCASALLRLALRSKQGQSSQPWRQSHSKQILAQGALESLSAPKIQPTGFHQGMPKIPSDRQLASLRAWQSGVRAILDVIVPWHLPFCCWICRWLKVFCLRLLQPFG
jgi:hypothetical protein